MERSGNYRKEMLRLEQELSDWKKALVKVEEKVQEIERQLEEARLLLEAEERENG